MEELHSPVLAIKALSVGKNTPASKSCLIENISLTVERGKTLALVGESGSGKSLTALSIMQLLPTGLQYGRQSEIWLQDNALLSLSEQQMQDFRGQRIGMIFQEPMTALNPVERVGKQISEVMRIHGTLSVQAAKDKTYTLLDAVGIRDPKTCYQQYPHQLSGGMKQRVMIAMALAGEPELIIADEPTTAVDVRIQQQILDLLQQLQQQRQLTMIFITHDLAVAAEIADDIAVMYAGQIVEQAPITQFMQQPLHPYSQQLFAALPSLAKRGQLLPVTTAVDGNYRLHSGCRFASRCPYVIPACNQQVPALMEAKPQQFARCIRVNELNEHNPHSIIRENLIAQPSANEAKLAQPILGMSDIKVHIPIRKGIFQRQVGAVKAVDGVSLALSAGKTLALVGESGCGKTTLAKALIGLMPITAGHITYQQQMLTAQSQRQAYMQMIFQDPYASLNPKMLIADILVEGLRARGEKIKDATRYAPSLQMLDRVRLTAASIRCYPHEFSGGQRQRIAIARALLLAPQILICDEPTSALDMSVQAQVLNLLQELQQQDGLSYLFITHNLSVVAYLADEVAVMQAGKIVEQGAVEKVFAHPQHAYTQTLLTASKL
jgi:peptide/nickel transport system ATP-binding protein